MFKAKKILILFGAAILALLSSCNFNNLQKKSATLVFDFTSVSGKVSTAARSTLSEVIEENETCYLDLKIQGGFEYNQTINLKETQIIQITDIPVGARITALADLYTLTINKDDATETKTLLYQGKSKGYTIIVGENNIQIPLKKYKPADDPAVDPDDEKDPAEDPNDPNNQSGGNQTSEDPRITIWVTYDEHKQSVSAWQLAFGGSNPEEEEGRDGKTKDTAFHYINSAIKWIANNGISNEDYKIVLTGYGTQEAFDQGVSIGEEVRGHANSITITSSDPERIAIRATTSPIFYMIHQYNSYPGPVPVIFENIQITSAATNSQNTSTLIIQTDTNGKCDVTLGKNAVFLREKGSTTLGSAITVGYGSTIKMEENARIYNFEAREGAAICSLKNCYITMNGRSNIDFCKSSWYGGAIYCCENGGTVTLNDDASITNCSSESGGAIYLKTGSFTMNSGTISGCNATNDGGAIYSSTESTDTSVSLYGGTITGNTAGYHGGAIYVKAQSGSMIAYLKMKGNICIDPGTDNSNDIYNGNNPKYTENIGARLELDDNLTTENPVAALLTYSALESTYTIITSSDNDIIKNSYSKIKVRVDGSQEIYGLTEAGTPDMP